jgi:hypothetical protein
MGTAVVAGTRASRPPPANPPGDFARNRTSSGSNVDGRTMTRAPLLRVHSTASRSAISRVAVICPGIGVAATSGGGGGTSTGRPTFQEGAASSAETRPCSDNARFFAWLSGAVSEANHPSAGNRSLAAFWICSPVIWGRVAFAISTSSGMPGTGSPVRKLRMSSSTRTAGSSDGALASDFSSAATKSLLARSRSATVGG